MGLNKFLIFFFLPAICLGQTKSIEIDWKPKKPFGIGYNTITMPWFEDGFSPGTYNVQYTASFEDVPYVDESRSTLENVEVTEVPASALGDLLVSELPDALTYRISNSLSRKRKYVSLEVQGFYQSGGKIYRVESFDVNFVPGSAPVPQKSTSYESSILATGDWYRFIVEDTGVHLLTRDFLESLGMDLNGVDPNTIKVYGSGGQSLPLVNAQTISYDPPEVPVALYGLEDGGFNNGDGILFYGQATDTEFNPENNSHINPYSDVVYYYVTSGGAPSKKVGLLQQPSGSPSVSYDYYHEVAVVENDEENIGNLGRRWFGNRFDVQPSQSFDFDFSNVRTDLTGSVTVLTAARSGARSNMSIAINGTIQNLSYPPITSSTNLAAYGRFYRSQNFRFNANTVNVQMDYNNGGDPSGVAYLDYIRLEVPVELRGGQGQFSFGSSENLTSGDIAAFNIASAQNITEVWDVSDRFNVTKVVNTGSSANMNFRVSGNNSYSFVALEGDDFLNPVRPSTTQVPNQNLKGTVFLDASGNFRDIDYLIITSGRYANQARRLAAHHIAETGLVTKVVTLEEIYREFSEGRQDIAAIRNFVKYVYDNASSPTDRVQYLNLFGETSFDYKDRLPTDDLVVPTYFSLESFSLTSSYVLDDFFTFMDPQEGGVSSNDLTDIAVGRMLFNSTAQARQMVNKAISYTSVEAQGAWRNRASLIGDDIDASSDIRIQTEVNTLADEIALNRPSYNVEKILLDSYQPVNSAGGQRYPDAVEDIENAFEQGSLLINYLGHGNEDGLAREFVITQSMLSQLRNPNNLPLLMTVTCEFTRFDNPLRLSGGEIAYKNPEGAAIALVTTNRLIFITDGVALNDVFDEYIFNYDNTVPISMAEALRRAKTDPVGRNVRGRRVVNFIGDPALRLALPKPKVVLTAVNDVPLGSGALPTLQALSRVKLTGEVQDLRGNRIQNYNGTVTTVVFDKKRTRQTLGNDGFTQNGQLVIIDFEELGNTIFRGKASISDGLFEVEFVVPRDIRIPLGNGRISFYAERENINEDQNGFNNDIVVGGINENAAEDNIGPQIDLYMNDTNFVSGGLTDSSPFLLALLEDDNGINTAAGIGHDLVGILDGDEVNPFILNDYYEADEDTFKSGQIYFPLRDIEPGLHTLKVKAWDTYNNSSEQEIQFTVAESTNLKLEKVLNYPNPMSTYTEFWFNHNRPFEPLDVNVQIMTVTGKVVYSRNSTVLTEGFTSRDLTWDGRDDFGQRLAKGVYLYKITVRSSLSDQTASKIEKLVIL